MQDLGGGEGEVIGGRSGPVPFRHYMPKISYTSDITCKFHSQVYSEGHCRCIDVKKNCEREGEAGGKMSLGTGLGELMFKLTKW